MKKEITPQYEMTQILSAVAMGRTPADLCIKNAKLINVCTSEILENIDVAIVGGRIALVGEADHCIGKDTVVIDAKGGYISPGFMDGHVHIESSMLTVTEYARAVIPKGTVGVFMDPHEISNVLGLVGMDLMREDGENTPLKVFVTTPSCVPAVDAFEDSGYTLSADDIGKTMQYEDVVGLGEMMNFPGVINGDIEAHKKLDYTLKAGKVITGHYAVPDTGKGLSAYVASGPRCCHESVSASELIAKMRLGMYGMIREGSAWRDLSEVGRAITENKIDTRFANLVSDDTHPNTLLEKGHLDYILKRAVAEGFDPVEAIQMVTINTAECFKMADEIGSITPGKQADIVFLKDLKDFEVTRTIINGKVVSENGKMIIEMEKFIYPEFAKDTMKISKTFTAEDFEIKTNKKEKALCRVIEVVESKTYNYERHIEIPVVDGKLVADIGNDVLKVTVIERHKDTGTKGFGFVKGFGIKKGAVGSTVSHDAHNLMVIGANDEDMALCANTIKEVGGGMVVCLDGEVIGLMPLPIAGLMSQLSAEESDIKIKELEKVWQKIGAKIQDPFMTMALIALACLIDLRLTNRGLVDINKFEFVDLEV